MRIDIRKVLLVLASVAVLIAIGIVIGININVKREYAKPFEAGQREWELVPELQGQMINDNYWSFIHASYILVGTYPDCLYYKIVEEIPRNDYDPEAFYIEEDDKMYYHDEDGKKASMIVLDISEFQPAVDFEAVREAGASAVMLRVGYRGYGSGKLVLDSSFESFAEAAAAAGLHVGVYFYSQAISYEEGAEEARFVLDAIKEYDIDYPVAIDTEAIYAEDARTNDLGVDARTDVVVGFCETIKAAGYEPMIYTNRNWLVQCLDLTRLGGYKLWYAHYTNQPDLPYEYVGWQYTDTGSFPGVSGNVDMNVWLDK